MNKKSFVIIFAIFLLVGTFGFVSADNKLQIWRNKTTGVNVSWIDNDGNFYGFGNVSAANFIGSGQYLTDLNVSAMDLSDYVPYTGANQNLVLGDNNFSVGGSDLFVDGGTGRVGIGTGAPSYSLEVNGSTKLNEDVYFDKNLRLDSETIIYTNNIQTGLLLRPVDSSEFGGFSYSGWGFTSESGTNRQAYVYMDGAGGDSIYSIKTSEDDGTSWNEHLAITQEGLVKLNKIILNTEEDKVMNTDGENKYILLGSSAQSTSLGAKQYDEDSNYNYLSYFSNNVHWDNTNKIWVPERTSLGRRSMLSMGYHQNAFKFQVDNTAETPISWTDLLTIGFDGNVGIGITNPQRTLHVNGDILSNATINATGDICIEGGICLSDAGTGSGNVQGTGVVNRAAFWTAGDTLGYDGNFTWDNTNKRLGIGTSTPQSKLNINGTLGSLAGGLTFGDGDTGFYEIADDQLYFNVAGSNIFKFMSSGMQGQGTNYFYIKNSPASSIVPPYTFRNDEDTGLGKAGDDKLSLIAGGVEGLRITTTNLTANNNMYVIGSLNATGDVCSSGGCLNDVVSGSVNANSSNYWDGLDTPSDILGSEINNDLNWINASEGVIVLGNWSADKDDYYTKLETYNQSEVDDMITSGTVNNSDLLDGYDSNFFMPLNTSVHGDFDFNGGWTDDGVSIVDGDIYAQAGYFYQINSLQVSTLEVNGSLIPDLDNSFDVGNSTLGWRNGYFTGDVVADSFVGDGSGLTNLNVSNIDLSDYVPYTGADKNLDLGNNNFSVNTNSLFVNKENGKVGIGTTSPIGLLHLSKSADSFLYIDSTTAGTGRSGFIFNTMGQLSFISNGATVAGSVGGELQAGKGVLSANSNNGLIIRTNPANPINLATNDISRLYITGDGKVGIGTTNPQNKLNVIGDINATGLIYGDGSQLTNLNVSNIDLSDYVPYTGANQNLVLGDNNFSVGGSDLFVDGGTGRVGIGIDSPESMFHVQSTGAVDAELLFDGGNLANSRIIVRADTDVKLPSIDFRDKDDPTNAKGLIGLDRNSNIISGSSQNDLFMNSDQKIHLATALISRLTVDSIGYVGINTTTPQNALNVIGDGNFTGNVYGSFIGDGSQLTNLNLSGVNGSTQWKDSGSDIYYNEGNVGIGTDNPSAKLEVNGGTIAAKFEKGSSLATVEFRETTSNGYAAFDLFNQGVKRGTFASSSVGSGFLPGDFWISTRANNKLHLAADTVPVLTIDDTEYVGIGTTNPQNKLNVIGDINVTGTIYGASFDGVENYWNQSGNYLYPTNLSKNVGIGVADPDQQLEVNGNIKLSGSGNVIAGGILRFDSGSGNALEFRPGGSRKMDLRTTEMIINTGFADYDFTINDDSNTSFFVEGSSGNVGINTTTPQNALNVIGDINATGLIYGNGSQLTGISAGLWSENGADIYYDDGNVGIGTISPTAKLEVNGTAKITGSMIIGETNITTEVNGDVQVW